MLHFLTAHWKVLSFAVIIAVFSVVTLSWSSLPFYWDTANFLIPGAQQIHKTGNILGYVQYTDYPHTFFLPVLISLLVALPYSVILIHGLGIVLSLLFLVVVYQVGRVFYNSEAGIALMLLFATNPLFLAQTHLVYFEVIGSALRYLALLLLVQKKYTAFTLISLVAVGFRLENGFILPVCAFVFLISKVLFFKSSSDWKKIVSSIVIQVGVLISWFCVHRLVSGWWIYSPTRFFDEQPFQTLQHAIVYSLFYQGRWVMTVSVFLLFSFSFVEKKILSLKNAADEFMFLSGVSAAMTLIMTAVLGYFLPRYTFPIIFFIYLLLVAFLSHFFSKKKLLLFSFILLFCLVQVGYRFSCWSFNAEDCLLVLDLLN